MHTCTWSSIISIIHVVTPFSQILYVYYFYLITGVVPKGGEGSNWSNKALDFFAEYVEGKFYVFCKSSEVGRSCGVVVLDTSGGNNKADNIVNQELINKGYADSALWLGTSGI